MAESIREDIMKQMLALPNANTEVADLTERDKIALAANSGCEIDFDTELRGTQTYLVAKTKNRIGIVKIEGVFRVYEDRSKECYVTVPIRMNT